MTFNLAIATCVKNEAPYIVEWIEFHRLMGFEHFYFYDNDSTDGSTEILKEYQRFYGIATYIPWPSRPAQKRAFGDALVRAREDGVRWCAFIDVDEFLFFPTGALGSEPYEAVGGIAIPWFLFGSSGHETQTPGLVIERFTKRAPLPDKHTKCIVQPRFVSSQGPDPHHFIYRPGHNAVDEHLIPIKPNTPFLENGTNEIFRINHYVTKSRAECEKRVARGRVDTMTNKPWPEYFYAHDRNEVEDLSIQKYLPALKERLG